MTGRSSSVLRPAQSGRDRVLVVLVVLFASGGSAAARGLGTDLASLNLCLYGDCEARGTYAADPYGLYNPATLGVATHMYFARGVALSGTYYHIGVGGLDGDIGLGVVTAG